MLERTRLLLTLLRIVPKVLAFRPDAKSSVADLAERQARRYPRRPFVRFEDREWSYSELNEAANRVAHWGRSTGLRQSPPGWGSRSWA
jgi:non-ribosomal peptide synthetase component F